MIEIFRNVRFRPTFRQTVVFVHKRSVLHGRPTQKRIVSDEWSDLAIGGTKGNGSVDSGSKRSDSIFKEMTDDLHDGRFVLDDGNVGRGGEFTKDLDCDD